MKLQQYLEPLLTKNRIAKVVCFATAILIYVVYHIYQVDKKSFVLPLEIVQNGNMTSDADLNRLRFVKVTVKTRPEYLATISEDDLLVYVDISAQAKEGKFRFPILIQPKQRLLLMDPLEITTTPETTMLELEENQMRYVPVVPTIAGAPAYGYELSDTKVSPYSIKIEGPRSIVENTERILTEKVDVADITQELEASVLPINPNRLLEVDTKTPITVTVHLSQVAGDRSIPKVPVVIANLVPSFFVTNGPFTVDVTVSGSKLGVESLSLSQILAQADCSAITEVGTHTVPLMVTAPGSISIDSQSQTSLQITVDQRESDSESSEADEMTGEVMQ